MNKNSLLSLNNVGKVFTEVGKGLEILRNISIEVEKGEFISIQGASGIGKSTLLHIMGLLDLPSSGNVFFQNKEITSLSDKVLSNIRNQNIGFVFQFHHLMPDFTAWENVVMPARIAGNYNKEVKDRAMALIEKVGMQERLQHLPSELSGGERQRLALARALINNPQLLLADEPSGNLDVENTRILHEMLRNIHEDLKISLIVVTHDQELANLAQKRYLLTATGFAPMA